MHQSYSRLPQNYFQQESSDDESIQAPLKENSICLNPAEFVDKYFEKFEP